MIDYFGVIVTFLIGFIVFLYTKKRDLVDKYPDTYLYKLFSYIDNLIEGFVKRTLPIENSSPVKKNSESLKVVDDLHVLLDIEELVSFREASYITFGFKARLPTEEASRILNAITITILSIVMVVWILFVYSLFSIAEGYGVPYTYYFLIFIPPAALVILFRIGMVIDNSPISPFNGKSFISDLFNLTLPNILSVVIDESSIQSQTPWSNTITTRQNTDGFFAETNDFRIGIYLQQKNQRKVWIFRYPRFFSHKLFNEEQLENLASKLNYEIKNRQKN